VLSANRPEHAKSLHSRWVRGFAQLTIVLIVSGLATFMGTQLLVQTFRDSAVSVEQGATITSKLRSDIIAHAIAVSTEPRTAAVQRKVATTQSAIQTGFEQSIAIEDGSAKALLEDAFAQWHTVVRITGGSAAHPVAIATRGVALSTRLPKVLALLDQEGSASRAAARANLADAARLNREAMAVLGLFELLALALAVRLARRLSSEVLRPVGTLRDAANHLAAGRLDHRVVVDRADELGELAVSFNTMADAIAGNQTSLTQQANTDSLSGLANRSAFYARLDATLAQEERRDSNQAVLFVDLDDFKDVNDRLGHAAGDEVLRVVAGRLRDTVRPRDLVARLGGDEFAVLLDGVVDPRVALTLAERVVAALAEPIEVAGSWVHVGACVGLARRKPESTVDTIMHEADLAMYAAKSKGKNRVERYDAEYATH
jgi:diguanylate cyclase (GGDEF)-like protein